MSAAAAGLGAIAGSCSQRFRELDRRVYSPLCLALAPLSLPAATRGSAPACGAARR
jgi:hypothetical protein